MTPMLSLTPVAMAVAIVFTGSVFAADLPKEGNYDHTACFTRNSTRIEYSKTHFAYSHEDTGTSLSNPPGGLFDNETIRCVGVVGSFDNKNSGSTFCVGVAPNGDMRLTRLWYDSDGNYQREPVRGTGQYDGMITTGSLKRVGQTEQIKPGTTKYCNHGSGTYKLK